MFNLLDRAANAQDPSRLIMAGNLLANTQITHTDPGWGQAQQMLGGLVSGLGQYGAHAQQQRAAEQLAIQEAAAKEMEIRKALQDMQQQQEDRAQRQEGIEAYRGFLEEQGQPELLARFNADPNGFLKWTAEQVGNRTPTADQDVDNQRLQDQLDFDKEQAAQQQANWEAEQGAKQAKTQAEAGTFSPELRRFYVSKVKETQDVFGKNAERYKSASESLASGTAVGDKAALYHVSRMISDEALNEGDIARGVSPDVIPAAWQSTINKLVGVSEFSPEQRAELQAQLDREIDARYSTYSEARNYVAETIPPQIREDEFQRVMGKTIPHPMDARRKPPVPDQAGVSPSAPSGAVQSAAPAATQPQVAPSGVPVYRIVGGQLEQVSP